MRKKYVVDIADIEVMLVERIDKQRNAAVYAGINESGTTVFDDQVAGVLP